MKKFEFLEHTADFKFRIYGQDLKEIVLNSLLALKEYLEPELAQEKIEKEIEVESADQTTLFIDFLSEVLANSYIEKAIFDEVEFFEFTPNKIKAKIKGKKIKSIKKEIKAITYHQAKIEKINSYLTFEFIIDI